MAIFMMWFRRLFGGRDSKYNILEKRGVQMIILICAVFLWELFIKKYTWWASLAIAVLVYIFWCCGHFYYFKCGTESDKYIDDELAKGRKPAMDWIVRPVNTWLGFAERTRQYCFVGMLIRYGVYALPVSLFVGYQFLLVGCLVPFIYNACFWISFPTIKWANSPTNWAEIITGFFIGWALW